MVKEREREFRTMIIEKAKAVKASKKNYKIKLEYEKLCLEIDNGSKVYI